MQALIGLSFYVKMLLGLLLVLIATGVIVPSVIYYEKHHHQTTSEQIITTSFQTTHDLTTNQITTFSQKTTGMQTTGIKTTEYQTTSQKTTSVQTTGVQTTQQQTTNSKTTRQQTTSIQTTQQQTTQDQTTNDITTQQFTTKQQTTGIKTTQQQTTNQKTTSIQTTQDQTTNDITTQQFTTKQQTTASKTTQQQTTSQQTTNQKTTSIQTTQDQTTNDITTQQFTTKQQTTGMKTTQQQTTSQQTTTSKTTQQQTTSQQTTTSKTTQQQTTSMQTTNGQTTSPVSQKYYIEGYWESWSGNSLQKIVSMKTDIIDISFFTLTSSGSGTYTLTGLDAPLSTMQQLINLAHSNGQLVKVSIGGASFPLSGILTSQTAAKGIATAIYQFVIQYGLDGVDFDIEDNPKSAYVIDLFQYMRALVGNNFIISYTCGTPCSSDPFATIIKGSYQYLTYLDLMAYDSSASYSYDSDIKKLISFGVSPQQIVIGLMPGKDDEGTSTTITDIQTACKYVIANGLYGIMEWSLDRDLTNETGLGIGAFVNTTYAILA